MRFWVYQGMLVRNAAPKGSSLLLPFHIFPGRVAKQIICMFASACGPGLCEKSPELSRYVLNRDHRGVPDEVRLYAYMIAPDSTATGQLGVTGMIADVLSPVSLHTFAEIAFPPFGHILAIDSAPPDRGLLDLTFLTQLGHNDWRDLHLKMPMRDVNPYFPSEFGTADEWTAALDNAHGDADIMASL